MLVIMYRLFSIREPHAISADHMFRSIFSDGVIAFFLSYLMHLTVQQPMKNLRQILVNWKQLFDVDNSAIGSNGADELQLPTYSPTNGQTKLGDDHGHWVGVEQMNPENPEIPPMK